MNYNGARTSTISNFYFKLSLLVSVATINNDQCLVVRVFVISGNILFQWPPNTFLGDHLWMAACDVSMHSEAPIGRVFPPWVKHHRPRASDSASVPDIPGFHGNSQVQEPDLSVAPCDLLKNDEI